MPGHVIQHLGDVLAELGHPAAAVGAGAGTVVGGLMHDLLARQMFGQRLALRPVRSRAAMASAIGSSASALGGILGLAGLQFLEPQLKLLDLPG